MKTLPECPACGAERPSHCTCSGAEYVAYQAAYKVASKAAAPCRVYTMFAFDGAPYCVSHRLMGPCPFGNGAAVAL